MTSKFFIGSREVSAEEHAEYCETLVAEYNQTVEDGLALIADCNVTVVESGNGPDSDWQAVSDRIHAENLGPRTTARLLTMALFTDLPEWEQDQIEQAIDGDW